MEIQNKKSRFYLVPFILLASLMFSVSAFSQKTQPAQLSLADILIALRSKKVTLDERNKILAEAVKVRGITFALTPEIEKELMTTGAGKELVDAIRQKTPATKPQPTLLATPTPMPQPTALDFQNRANLHFTKGEFDSAIADYSKVIEMKSADASVFLNRGLAYSNKKNYDLAIDDFDKVIELNPKDSAAYFNRGDSYEKSGNIEKAMADYQKAFELDANNEAAQNNLKRLQDEQAKTAASQQKTETATTTETNNTPQNVNLGTLNNLAVNLVMPVYPSFAQKSAIQGKVTVQVSLDEEGKVISAKAIDGPPLLRSVSEDAARKSKFKPARIGEQVVKATGVIVYNFKAS